MKIEFSSENEDLELKNHAIRKAFSNYDESENHHKVTYFQGLILDKRRNKSGNIYCLITYFDKENNFLGLDKNNIWDYSKSDLISLSMPITVPDNVETVVVEISEKPVEKRNYNELLGVLLVFFFFFTALLLLKVIE